MVWLANRYQSLTRPLHWPQTRSEAEKEVRAFSHAVFKGYTTEGGGRAAAVREFQEHDEKKALREGDTIGSSTGMSRNQRTRLHAHLRSRPALMSQAILPNPRRPTPTSLNNLRPRRTPSTGRKGRDPPPGKPITTCTVKQYLWAMMAH